MEQTEAQKRIIEKLLKASEIINKAKISGNYSFIVTDGVLEHVQKVHNCDRKEALRHIENVFLGTNVQVNKELEQYKIDIMGLIDKPIIRDDQPHEWMNKLTDEELAAFNDNLPHDSAEATAKIVDNDILYTIFKNAQ